MPQSLPTLVVIVWDWGPSPPEDERTPMGWLIDVVGDPWHGDG